MPTRLRPLRWLLAVVVVAVLCAAAANAPRVRVREVSVAGPTMGTTYRVTHTVAATPKTAPLSQADLEASSRDRIMARLAEINRRMSTYDPHSELSRFNASESLDWFEVSQETANVVASALRLAEDSGGAYDPTVGPVVNLWGFGPSKRRFEPPSDEEIGLANQRVGWRKVETRLDPPGLRKTHAGVYLDLSSIAKGFAADAVSELLSELGSENSMVEVGGEIMTRGAKPGGSRWRIGVEKPNAQGRLIQTVLPLSDEALATSGDYRNFFEHAGVRYSHTIDPATGRPVTHDLATVSVRAATCLEADAHATAILVMGPELGYDWAEQRGVAALLIRRGDDGLVELETTAWRQAIKSGRLPKPEPAASE